jgi:shikimate kinase
MTAPSLTLTLAEPITLPAGLRRIVLTGFMGAGKTSVGRLLAEALGWSFLDLDAHLEARANASIPELFALHGESRFRRLESSALANALSRTETVLALGGGTPEEMTNRLLLEQTPGTLVVFLDAPFPTLFDRCMLQAIEVSASPESLRPVLASPEQAESRFRTRHPLYQRLARMTIHTADLAPVAVAQSLIAVLGARGAEGGIRER